MKQITTPIVFALICSLASAQQSKTPGPAATTSQKSNTQHPSVSPPVGGFGNPGALINDPIVGARRDILQDTAKRQYSAEEIQQYRNFIDAYDRAKAGNYSEAAKLIRRRINIGISPDSPVEEIRLNAENVGSIVFTDSLGNPWNVDDVLVPDYIIAMKKENMIVFTPNSKNSDANPSAKFARGSITVLLEGLRSTIPFGLSYGLSKQIDSQIEAQVQARNLKGPANPIQSNLIEADEVAEQFLDGEPPQKSKEIKTSHKSVKSWLYGGKLYVRTPLALHSPAYQVYAASAAGMSVFRFDGVPTIINAIHDGEIVSVSIGD